MKALRLSLSLTSGMAPALALDFLSGSLDARVTFTRGSNATLTDSTGKVTYAPSNLLTYSQEFDNAAWTKNNPGVAALPVVTANAGVAPDGTTTADRIQFNCVDVGSAVNRSLVTANPSQPTGVNYVGSVWVKAYDVANVGKTLRFAVDAFGSGVFTLTSEWQRIKINGLATATVGNFILETRGTFTTQTADALVWGAQLEPVTYQTTPGTYVATTSSAYYGPRFDYDPVTLAAKGLLVEEARTNLLTYSEQFDNAAWTKSGSSVTANSTTAPDGSTTADKLVEDAANSTHYVSESATTTAATYAFSWYIKAAERSFVLLWNATANFGRVFNLSNGTVSGTVAGVTQATADITNVGNGWYRCTIYGTCTAASNSFRAYTMTDATTFTYLGNGTSGAYLWGAQLEAGAFATSYIPTVASTATRSADVATMTGTNFSSWYNQSAGTFVAAFDRFGFDSSAGSVLLAQADDGTTNNRVALRLNARLSEGAAQATIVNGGSVIVNAHAGALTSMADRNVRAAMAYQVGTPAVGRDGSVADVAAAASLPTVNQLTIGQGAGAAVINGHIRSFAYFNTRLPNAQLQSLTA